MQADHTSLLIDCGASALIGMKQFGIDPGSIDSVVLTHLHGDHFGGLAFLIRESQVAAERTRPLTIIGPPGHESAVRQTTELLFPGADKVRPTFETQFVQYRANITLRLPGMSIDTVRAIHTPGTSPHAVRVSIDRRSIAYSGDTEWTDELLKIANDSDLFVCEAYHVERVRNHMDYRTLVRNLPRIRCRRIVLTHMAPDVLALRESDAPERATDGMQIDL